MPIWRNENELLSALAVAGFPDISVSQALPVDLYTVTIMKPVRQTVVETVVENEWIQSLDADGNAMKTPDGAPLVYQATVQRQIEREVDGLEPTDRSATGPSYYEALEALLAQVQ